jgi:hypothetical protein
MHQVYGPEKPLSRLMDLSETWAKVNGPMMYLTLYKTPKKSKFFTKPWF